MERKQMYKEVEAKVAEVRESFMRLTLEFDSMSEEESVRALRVWQKLSDAEFELGQLAKGDTPEEIHLVIG